MFLDEQFNFEKCWCVPNLDLIKRNACDVTRRKLKGGEYDVKLKHVTYSSPAYHVKRSNLISVSFLRLALERSRWLCIAEPIVK